ncbi:MAG: Sec-independent protein translocase protein TatB [Endozoicomonas sp.]
MLDIGFTELLLIAVISLVVLGPERLPGAVRSAAYWISKVRRSFQSVKDELERELDVDGIRRQIHNEAVMKELEKAKQGLQDTVNQPLSAADQTSDDKSAPEPSAPVTSQDENKKDG